MNATCTGKLQLEYRREGRLRRQWIRRATFFAVVLVAGLIGWKYGPAQVERCRSFQLKRECLNYRRPPDMIVYDNDPAALSRPMGASSEYWALPSVQSAVRLAGHAPKLTQSVYPGLPYPVLFFGQRRSPDGTSRLVTVAYSGTLFPAGAADPYIDPLHVAFVNTIPVNGWTLAGIPANASWEHIQTVNASYAYAGAVAPRLRILAGQPDSADESHFTVNYLLNDFPGVLDGWVQNDGTVRLVERPGPANLKTWEPGITNSWAQSTNPATSPSTAPAILPP